uniref:BTB domain-containing protein n=1 Tax=Plectus sambesii TaxID=2011161 RepID=A0A914WN92_9BILA
MTSRKFVTVKDHVGYTWCLKLYPKGLKFNDKNYLNLQLCVVYLAGPKESVYANILSNNDLNNIQLCANSSKTGSEHKIGSDVFIYTLAPGSINSHLTAPDENGNQLLICTIKFILRADLFINLPFKSIPRPVACHWNDPLLLKVLSGQDDKLSDFSIIADGYIFATNRCILAVHCPYFEQFFVEGGEEWIEKATSQMSSPISKRAMREILTYIYTGRVNIPSNNGVFDVELLEELVCGADYFRLPQLQKHYERPLYEHLMVNQTSENALSYFIIADRYEFKLLKACALSVLHDHLDWIEDHVKNVLSNPVKAPSKNVSDKEDKILTYWKTLKENRSDGTSFMDEVVAFTRQINATHL